MTADSIAFGAMVGLGESYMPAFALALGHGSINAGLVATVPMRGGAVLQLVTPAAVGLFDSHRSWVVLCAAMQSASFVPLIAGALAGQICVTSLYLAAMLYWGLGMSTGPAWTAWATTLIPLRVRERYLARRAAMGQAALVAALLVAGGLLAAAEVHDATLTAFALLFGLAMIARPSSLACLLAPSEPRPVPLGETRISPVVIARHVRTGGHVRLLGFLLCFQLGVCIAAPYFTPYMLQHLELDYIEFTLLTTCAFSARVVALPWIADHVRRLGTRRVLSLASGGIVPLPILWLLSDDFWWLFALQVVSGFAWAAFELGTLLSCFERIPARGQTSVLTVYNLANASAIAVGTLIGAAVLDPFEDPATGLTLVMVLSTVARLLVVPLLRHMEESPCAGPPPPLRTIGVRPSAGALQRPILEPQRNDTR
ncbi:MAG: MFS transporter [Deltaproteobacteria bacterium]|jgi:MFS family permease|nr:MFS transporter [Deltaproteobacteria bacterium]